MKRGGLAVIPTALEPDMATLMQEMTDQMRALREALDRHDDSGQQPGTKPPMYEFPVRISRALVAPEKYTSTLPYMVLEALRRFARQRGGENINVIISEALRAYIPRQHFVDCFKDLQAEQRRLWSEEASREEIQG